MSSRFCKRASRCKNKDWCADDYKPTPYTPECFEPMTNADRIRSMSDAQLAEFLAQFMDKCWKAGWRGECDEDCPMYECCNDQPSDNVEEWLKQEVQRWMN